MLKNRDTGELNNRVEYFNGEKYNFIGLVNSPSEGGEVWSGTNDAGFCIMNTASYNIKSDSIPYSQMDKEGEIMFEALGVCKTVDEFESFIVNHSKPLGVEANFGVIDAFGGAAYFEVNNFEYVRYDVNEGYRVVTNFSESGRKEDCQGWERYLTASDILSKEIGSSVSPKDIFNKISRSYKHHLLGIDYDKDEPESGICVDQDFIPRRKTASCVVFEGVKEGENPLHTIMWTMLGYPSCSIAIPLFVGKGNCLPDYVQSCENDKNCRICNFSLDLKKNIFPFETGNGEKYLNVRIAKQMKKKCSSVEDYINNSFYGIHSKWCSGLIDDDEFYSSYLRLSPTYCNSYFALFTEND